jgi:hypothetical protein
LHISDKDMLVAELDFGPTDVTDMLSAANSDEYQQPICFMDSIDDFSKKGDSFVSLRTFIGR